MKIIISNGLWIHAAERRAHCFDGRGVDGFAIVSATLMNIRRSEMMAHVNKLRSFVFSYDLENLFIFHSV